MARHLARRVYRVLADHSLRRFLVYAANPLNWPQLAAMRAQRKAEITAFAGSLAPWLEMTEVDGSARHFVFRRWLTSPPDTALRQTAAPPVERHTDPELRMRIDRLGWVLEGAIEHPAAAWAEVAGWLAARPAAEDFHRDSYSISERLANLIMLWNLCAPDEALSQPLAAMMLEEADLLLRRPEYHGQSGTNNHILNNARGLILAGTFFDSSRLFDAGCWIFENQFGRHVLADGVVREGSSHYQWVITRWIIDIACAFRYRDEDAYRRLLPSLQRMLDACDAMAIGTPGRWYLPLVGDISPDFPPGFYCGLSGFGRKVIQDDAAPEEASAKNSAAAGSFWTRHFGADLPAAGSDWIAADGSWARMTRGSWTLLAHADTCPGESRPTHGHHDLFSFDLAFAGQPVIVDPGRGNYLSGRDEEAAGILEEWHNTVMVGTVRTGFVPRGYMPSGWLAAIRPSPVVCLDAEGLHLSIDAMPGMPNASVHRMFAVDDAGGLRIVTRVSMAAGKPLPVRQVLYLAAEAHVEDECAHLRLDDDGREIVLRWSGLGRPAWRPAVRYVAYANGIPCTRLEWNVPTPGARWESVIAVMPAEDAR